MKTDEKMIDFILTLENMGLEKVKELIIENKKKQERYRRNWRSDTSNENSNHAYNGDGYFKD